MGETDPSLKKVKPSTDPDVELYNRALDGDPEALKALLDSDQIWVVESPIGEPGATVFEEGTTVTMEPAKAAPAPGSEPSQPAS